MFFDFLLFEFLAIIINTIILKKVGSHPAALGPLRNFFLKYGPRLIKTAVVEVKQPVKKAPAKKKQTPAEVTQEAKKK